MFERRLKILLFVLALGALLLLFRAGQVQVVQHAQWSDLAEKSQRRTQLIETIRGKIRDRNGQLLAEDEPCVHVCIDYRAITEPPDEKWVLGKAEARVKTRLGDEWEKTPRSKRKELSAAEAPNVKADIRAMWGEMARIGLRTPEQIEETRQGIVNRVAMRQRIAWLYNYRRAMKQEETRKEEAFWRRWLVEGISADKSDAEKYAVTVEEELQSHVVLRAVDVTVQNHLGKHADRYPGLELKAATHRSYPYGSTACHLMGRVTKVMKSDIEKQDAPDDELRQYLPNDEIGRGGVEQLAELALRGTRGKVEKSPGKQEELSRVDPRPGQDVTITIDIALQQRIEAALAKLDLYDAQDNVETITGLHGAAVVIDVASGEVLALASAPGFDLNTFEEFYTRLADDDLNSPMLNRATMAQLQPGSTMKPFVGLGAIASGKVTAETGIECTGYMLRPDGRKWPWGRCWVASKFENDPRVPSVAHHPIPIPHPTGFLTFSDALERSCNIYFETMAERLGMEGLSAWYERFGLGRPTGIGISEANGRLPRSFTGPASMLRQKTWFSGIGQDPVAATPIQMANACATMARGGVWRRPVLIAPAEMDRLKLTSAPLKPAPRRDAERDPQLDPATQESPRNWPEAYDLGLPPASLAAARDGMERVIYGSAGTGKSILRHAPTLAGIRVCGKTGTAQASRFAMKERDPATGKVVLDANGKPKMRILEPGTAENPNPIAPWYRAGGPEGRELNHAWYIGYAPADKPTVAFAVMVEYGGSGGGAAAALGREVLTACVEKGYLKAGAASALNAGPTPGRELLRDIAAR